MYSGYLKQISCTVVLAAATAFAQATPPAPPAPPSSAQDDAEAPKGKVKTPKAPKAPRTPRGYAYAFTGAEGGSYLGVGVRDVTTDTMKSLNLRDERGVEVISVDQDGPAAKAGVKEHDVILTFNGQNVEGYEQMRRMIRETPAGRKVKLGISRNGQPSNVEVALGKREDTWTVVRPGAINIPPINIPPMNFEWDTPGFTVLQVSSRNGATVEDLTQQLGEYFGVKNGDGVLVRSVERGSPAESAGLKAGDVIVRVNNEAVSNSGEFRRLMRQQKSGAAIPLTILRDRREQNVSLKLPERKSSDAAYRFYFPDDTEQFEEMIQQNVRPVIERTTRVALASAQKTIDQQERELRKQLRELDRELQKMQKDMSKDTD